MLPGFTRLMQDTSTMTFVQQCTKPTITVRICMVQLYYLKGSHYIQYKCTINTTYITLTNTDSSYAEVKAAIFTKPG